jgi:hypothetical protein
MKQAAFIKFFQEVMERDMAIAQRSGWLDQVLRDKSISMFFRQGLSHSNQGTGVFSDQYRRCAYIKDPIHSLVYLAIKGLSEKFANDQEFIIPMSDDKLAARIICSNNPLVHTDFVCNIQRLRVANKQVIGLRVKSQTANTNSLFDLLKFIANWGGLANQDALIQILIDLGHMPNNYLVQDEQCLSIVNDNINISTFDVIQLLRQAPRVANLKAGDAQSYAFYCMHLEQLIQGFYDQFIAQHANVSMGEQLLYVQALRRLYLKLLAVQNKAADYKVCMSAIEFAFDEVTNVLSIAKLYPAPELFASIKQYVSDCLHLPADNMSESVALAGSCMQLIHRRIISALQYVSAADNNKQVRLYISNDLYYEVSKSWGIDQDFLHDQYVTFCNMQAQSTQNYAEQIVDLMLLNFHANVNRKKRGFGARDVVSIIDDQFKLRAAQNDPQQLIVILDITLTNLADIHISSMLANFAEQIRTGKLAIILITSLNKYCHIGFDRFPSGIGVDFYAKELFPNLIAGNELLGFAEYDAVPQTVAHFLRHAQSSTTTYYRMVHEFSRNLHDQIIPPSLYNVKNPIHVDPPYSNDGYNRPWGFMVIRFANEKITAEYKPKLQAFLNSIGIEYRDGFAFNCSTYSSIGANLEILRISIGPNASADQYKTVVDFITATNTHICSADPSRTRPSV